MKKVSFIGWKDYANVMTEYSAAINKYCEGFESKVICEIAHPIKYPKQHDYNLFDVDDKGNLTRRENDMIESKKWILDSDHIIFAPERGPIEDDFIDLVRSGKNSPHKFIKTFQKMGEDEPQKRMPGIKRINEILKFNFLKETKAAKNKNIHLYHTGTHYRNNFNLYNYQGIRNFNKLIHGVDLYRLSWYDTSPSNDPNKPGIFPEYLGGFLNSLGVQEMSKKENHVTLYTSYERDMDRKKIEDLIDKKFNTNELIIFHAPTSKEMKGTNVITDIVEQVIERLEQINIFSSDRKIKFITPQTYEKTKHLCDKETGWIDNSEIMKLKEMSHIYIDEFNPFVGYFGGSTVEALMSGNITFATINNFSPDAMEAANKNINAPDCPVIHLGTTPNDFGNVLFSFLQKSTEEMKNIAKDGLEWYHQTSTHKAVATKFEKEILI
tara:strand:- start:96 stop:1409 length:1314 start_codon:yes stop_codon:yes gene_type:complete